MLGCAQDFLEPVQTKLQSVPLGTQLVFLLARHAELDLDVLDRFVMAANDLLGIIRKIATCLGKFPFLLLLPLGKLVNLLDGLAREFAQILERLAARLNLGACSFVNIKNLRLVRLNRTDRILQDTVKRLGAEAFHGAAGKLQCAHAFILVHPITLALPLQQFFHESPRGQAEGTNRRALHERREDLCTARCFDGILAGGKGKDHAVPRDG